MIQKFSITFYTSSVTFVKKKIAVMTGLVLSASMNFFPNFPKVFTAFDEIR
jgi:hypothetical protein